MKEITTQELKKIIDAQKTFVLLDCRMKESYAAEHLPGAINLRWKYVPEQAGKLLPDKKTMIVTYCGGITCDASIRCYKNLQDLGYTNLVEYSGGLEEWKANQYETIKGVNQ